MLVWCNSCSKRKDKENGCEITFDGAGLWSFDNDTARNVMFFVVDNSSSSYAKNYNNNYLVLDESQLLELMEVLVHQRKSLVLISVKQTQNFA